MGDTTIERLDRLVTMRYWQLWRFLFQSQPKRRRDFSEFKNSNEMRDLKQIW